MKTIGLFYSAGITTANIVAKIADALMDVKIELIAVENAHKDDFETYDNIIFGASTWFDGELPTCWDEFIPELKTVDMQNKRVAIFGLGDQKNYPDNFVDSIGILARLIESNGATLIGLTSTEGYSVGKSVAVRDGYFLGLAIDEDNQSDKTEERIKNWVVCLKKDFYL